MASNMKNATVSLIIAHPKFMDLAIEAASLCPTKPAVIAANDYIREQVEIIVDQNLSFPLSKPAVVIFTSGTSGNPKGCLYENEGIVQTTKNYSGKDIGWNITENDHVVSPLPVHHVGGIIGAFLPYMFAGAHVEFMTGTFKAKRYWDRWKEGGIDIFFGVPTAWVRLLRHYENEISKLPEFERLAYVKAIQNIRLLFAGSATLPEPVKRKWEQILDGKSSLIDRYGSTELGLTLYSPSGVKVPDGAVGWKLPTSEIKFVESGEMLVRNKGMFSRYLFNPEATKNAFTADGFYRTGDLGELKDGFYYIKGRASTDIIKCGGYKLSAPEIERVIASLDYVDEVCVIGVEDEEWGQRVGALVVLQNKNSLTINELRQDLSRYLAGYKSPTLLLVVDSIPRNSTGKMVRRELGKMFTSNPLNPNMQIYIKNENKLALSRL